MKESIVAPICPSCEKENLSYQEVDGGEYVGEGNVIKRTCEHCGKDFDAVFYVCYLYKTTNSGEEI